MSDPSGSSKRGWRHNVPGSAPKAAAVNRGWKDGKQPVAAARPWSRKSKFKLALLGLAVCAGGIALLIWLLRPPRPSAIVLVGAEYENNLAIDHNHYGWKGLQDLHQWADHDRSSWWGRGTPRPSQSQPARLSSSERDWAKDLDRATEDNVICFLALHGGADENGAYLLYDGDPANPQDRLRLEDVINRLKAELDKNDKKRILLILDPAQLSASWASGTLHNDFVRRLKSLESKLPKHLLILCGTDEGQKSWVFPQFRRTIFAHKVIEGLKGAAADDGRVTAASLSDYVKKGVPEWVSANRDMRQTPILLPSTDEGQRLAAAMHLVTINKEDYRADETSKLDIRYQQLEQKWNEWSGLRNQAVPPWVHSPQIWREYQDTLLRYERVVRAGADAGYWTDQLARLKRKLETNRELSLDSIHSALPIAAALGWSLPNDTSLAKAVDELIDAKGDAEAFKAQWKNLVDVARGLRGSSADELDAQLLDRVLQNRVIDRLFDRGADLPALHESGRLLLLVGALSKNRPAEAHLAFMLPWAYRQSNAFGLGNPPAALMADYLREMLHVRRLAEQAAWASGTTGVAVPANPESEIAAGYAYAERASRWIALDRADALRRQGEDLLFAAKEAQWKEGMNLLQNAKTFYQTALNRAQVIRSAYATRDRLLAELPYYSVWLARRRVRTNKEAEGERGEAELDGLTAKLQSELWKIVHKMALELRSPGVDAPLVKLEALQKQALAEFQRLAGAYRNKYSQLAASNQATQGTWHEIEDSLRAPLIDDPLVEGKPRIRSRIQLLERSDSLAERLEKEPGRQAVTPLTADEDNDRIWKTARREAELAVAALGEPWINQRQLRSFNGLNEDIRNAQFDWQDKLIKAGKEIAAHHAAVGRDADLRVEQSQKVPPRESAATLIEADYFTRLVEGVHAKSVAKEPSATCRNVHWHLLFAAQAERVYRDHWFDETGDAYYLTAARRYSADARKIVKGYQDPEENPGWFAELVPWEKPAPRVSLTAVSPKEKRLIWTTELDQRIAYEWRAPQLAGPGAILLWNESNKSFPLRANPPDGEWKRGSVERECMAFDSDKSDGSATAVFKVHPIKGGKLNDFRKFAFFRGQVLGESVEIKHQPDPDIVVRHHQLDNIGGIAAVADKGDQAAIAFVFDCSLSMKDGGKYDAAVNALKDVFAQIPPGTYVSFRVFGHQDGANAFTTERIEPPMQWTPENGAKIIKQLKEKYGPKGGTPGAAAIVEASKDGFPDNFRGYRTIVVLTDGMDTDENRNANPSSAKWVQEKLRKGLGINEKDEVGNGVVLTVVLFMLNPPPNAKDAEKEAARREKEQAHLQFDPIAKFKPAGKVLEVTEARDLFGTIKEHLRPKMRLLNVDTSKPVAEAPDGINMSLLHEPLQWSPPLGLETRKGKGFRVEIHQNPALESIYLEPEDRLLLLSRLDDKRLSFERGLYSDLALFEKKRRVETKDWRLAALANGWMRNSPDRRLEAMLTLERHTFRKGIDGTMRQPQPGFSWIEVRRADEDRPAPIRFGNLTGYPAPARYVESPEWHNELSAPPPISTFDVWWTGTYTDEIWKNAKVLDARRRVAPPEVKPVGDVPIRIHAAIETHPLELQPGVAETKPCLVIRWEHAVGERYVVRIENPAEVGILPEGEAAEGAIPVHEYRLFSSVGRGTAIFRLHDPEKAKKAEIQLQVISVEKLKQGASEAKQHLQLKSDQPPALDDRRPMPIRLEKQ